MDTSFLFDEFFVNSSVYTVDFVVPVEHNDLIVDLLQLSNHYTSLFLLQFDSDTHICVTFVSAYSVGQFHKYLFDTVNRIRRLHKLSYKDFHYE